MDTKNVQDKNDAINWTIMEPNPSPIRLSSDLIKSFFTSDIQLPEKTDLIVHSHVLEHMYDPLDFLKAISDKLGIGAVMIEVPDLEAYENIILIEHTIFLDSTIIDYMLNRTGFEIIEKFHYGNGHSIFYKVKKSDPIAHMPVPLENKYEINKWLNEFVSYYENDVKAINKKLGKHKDSPKFLFGAHVFSQYLINFGLISDQSLHLDNNLDKQNRRLYGTDLMIESPEILSNYKSSIGFASAIITMK